MKKLDEFIAKTKKASAAKGASLGGLGVQRGIAAFSDYAEGSIVLAIFVVMLLSTCAIADCAVLSKTQVDGSEGP